MLLGIERLVVLPFWWRMFCALVVGVAGALAQEPFGFAPLILAMLALGFVILASAETKARAWVLGWVLGLGYFAVALSWITAPFQVDAAATAWMAPFALGFMAAGMGLFWAMAFLVARWLQVPAGLALTWTLAEVLRAYLFTGFPWGTPAQAVVGRLADQGLAFVGPHGVMLILCGFAWAISTGGAKREGRLILRWGALVAGAALLSFPSFPPEADLSTNTVRIVQPNAPQHEKWDPIKSRVFTQRLLDFTSEGAQPDLVLWPETSVPYLLHNATGLLQAAGEAGRGAPVAMGILRQDDTQLYNAQLYNAMVILDGAGEVTQTYDKHHIVPFGEYIPLRPVFAALGLRFIGDMFGEGFGRGPGAQVLDLGPLGKALPLICYEGIFAHDVSAAPERPDFLMQLTNDAWFGDFAGPQQHLAQARMRAIEQGLPMARAANTGISAMIDPYGHVTQSLGLGQAGYIDALLPQPLAPTLYSKTGDRPLIILLCLVALMCLVFKMRALRVC